MSAGEKVFHPWPSLLPGRAHAACRACVTIPVRNEEQHLPACLDAFAYQVDEHGDLLSTEAFEVLLLLNNCTDRSIAIATGWQRAHPEVRLCPVACEFPPEQAHAGTARRLLMDTAWQRLGGDRAGDISAILTTDADSVVAPDWIAQNMLALRAGSDAVGGSISLSRTDVLALPEQVRHCYINDRRYAELISQLEDLLDPQPGDPCPRHLDHFGSSLACTAQAYARAGGMPAVAALEDEAFVDRLRRADLRLRHEPTVRVFTSARLQGRAKVGLAGQLRCWNDLPSKDAHTVQSAAFLAHRFRMLGLLRRAFALRSLQGIDIFAEGQHEYISNVLMQQTCLTGFLSAINCDGLIRDTFQGPYEERISEALHALELQLRQLQGSRHTFEHREAVLRAMLIGEHAPLRPR